MQKTKSNKMMKYLDFENEGLIPLTVIGVSIILFPVRMWFAGLESDTHLLTRFCDLTLIVIGTAIATVGICSLYYSANKK